MYFMVNPKDLVVEFAVDHTQFSVRISPLV